jgi:predicted MPP superfamily phosphohydrolase
MLSFVIIALSVWAALNGYALWRLNFILSTLWQYPRWLPWVVGVLCWSSFPLSMWLRGAAPALSDGLGIVSTNWLGAVFILTTCFLILDVATLGGFLFAPHMLVLRSAAASVAVALSVFAFVQGHCPPVVREVEVELPGMPAQRDGTRLVFISDLHLGAQIGATWFNDVVRQIDDLRPDVIAIGGDLIDHDAARVLPMVPQLKKLRAPLGVWAVLGNHDVYSGLDESARIISEAGYRLLRDESSLVAPGLRIAGVDDIGVRGGKVIADAAMHEAMRNHTKGGEGCIMLSHTPEGMEAAANDGAGLMLSGHTHGGQIWPFSYLVQMRFPTLVGRYSFGRMSLIVSRGSGTWGPRMRLWQPGELYLITLRSPKG